MDLKKLGEIRKISKLYFYKPNRILIAISGVWLKLTKLSQFIDTILMPHTKKDLQVHNKSLSGFPGEISYFI